MRDVCVVRIGLLARGMIAICRCRSMCDVVLLRRWCSLLVLRCLRGRRPARQRRLSEAIIERCALVCVGILMICLIIVMVVCFAALNLSAGPFHVALLWICDRADARVCLERSEVVMAKGYRSNFRSGPPRASTHSTRGEAGGRHKMTPKASAENFRQSAKYAHPLNQDRSHAAPNGQPMRGGIRL